MTTPQSRVLDVRELRDFPAPRLAWGIKRSFAEYLTKVPDGEYVTTGGAQIVSGQVACFEQGPNSTYDPGTGTGLLRFRGEVRVSGHYGMLAIRITDPWVEFRADAAALTVVDHRYPDANIRLDLVAVTLGLPTQIEPGLLAWEGVLTRLTSAGRKIFDGNYNQGEAFDPISIIFRQ